MKNTENQILKDFQELKQFSTGMREIVSDNNLKPLGLGDNFNALEKDEINKTLDQIEVVFSGDKKMTRIARSGASIAIVSLAGLLAIYLSEEFNPETVKSVLKWIAISGGVISAGGFSIGVFFTAQVRKAVAGAKSDFGIKDFQTILMYPKLKKLFGSNFEKALGLLVEKSK
ncbi:MAG: hypothetical protein FWC61_01040 [Proteobacteria bacterium]|nr:hypothetical protein [Pseudomonadota bacterium]